MIQPRRPMSQRSRQNDKREHLAHIDALLQEAISQWQPEQPRRWLAKYGGWAFEGNNPLVLEYRAIRRQAMQLLKRRR